MPSAIAEMAVASGRPAGTGFLHTACQADRRCLDHADLPGVHRWRRAMFCLEIWQREDMSAAEAHSDIRGLYATH